jgi:hypothetical protein
VHRRVPLGIVGMCHCGAMRPFVLILLSSDIAGWPLFSTADSSHVLSLGSGLPRDLNVRCNVYAGPQYRTAGLASGDPHAYQLVHTDPGFFRHD